jgi:hypothetical protein
MTETSSRWFRYAFGAEVMALTFAASAAGRWEVPGTRWPRSRRLSVGRRAYVRRIMAYWRGKAGIRVSCSGLELSSSTRPATCSGYLAEYVIA